MAAKMKITDFADASRLVTKWRSLKERRDAWAKVDLTGAGALVPRLINNIATSTLPMLDDDIEMNSVLVQTIVVEYDKRIDSTERELIDMGVEIK